MLMKRSGLRRKGILPIWIAAALALLLSACGPQPPDSDGTTPSGQEPEQTTAALTVPTPAPVTEPTQSTQPAPLQEEAYENFMKAAQTDLAAAIQNYGHYERPEYEAVAATSDDLLYSYEVQSWEPVADQLWMVVSTINSYRAPAGRTVHQFVGRIDNEYRVMASPEEVPPKLKDGIDLEPYFPQTNLVLDYPAVCFPSASYDYPATDADLAAYAKEIPQFVAEIQQDSAADDESRIQSLLGLLFDAKRYACANPLLEDFDYSIFYDPDSALPDHLAYFSRSVKVEKACFAAYHLFAADSHTDLTFRSISVSGDTAEVEVYEWLGYFDAFTDNGSLNLSSEIRESGRGIPYSIVLRKTDSAWLITDIDFYNETTFQLKDPAVDLDEFIQKIYDAAARESG